MKKSELRQIIKEEYQKILKETKEAESLAEKIMAIEDAAWDKFRINSGNAIRENSKIQKQYIDYLDNSLKKYKPLIKKNGREIFKILEIENRHTFCIYLVMKDFISSPSFKNHLLDRSKDPDSWDYNYVNALKGK